MRLVVAILALVAFAASSAAYAGTGCTGMQTAGKPSVVASTDGTPLPQTPVRLPKPGDSKS